MTTNYHFDKIILDLFTFKKWCKHGVMSRTISSTTWRTMSRTKSRTMSRTMLREMFLHHTDINAIDNIKSCLLSSTVYTNNFCSLFLLYDQRGSWWKSNIGLCNSIKHIYLHCKFISWKRKVSKYIWREQFCVCTHKIKFIFHHPLERYSYFE